MIFFKLILNIVEAQINMWWKKTDNDKKLLEIIRDTYNKYLSDDKDINCIVGRIKDMFIQSRNNKKELSELLDEYLIPQEVEKKTNAEISTPYKLRKDMLNNIPEEFWIDENPTVFEPCCGKGGFLIDMVDSLMSTGLSVYIEDEEERYRFIVENCIYFADINPTNIFICKLLLDPEEKYSLNYYEGNTLTFNPLEYWGIDKFKLVVTNPPYNSVGKTGTGNTIWQSFVLKGLEWSSDYMCMVHPSGWRKPNVGKTKNSGLFDMMTRENQLLYLEIHDSNDGLRVFKCGTRYDWYVLERRTMYKDTVVVDEKGVKNVLDLSEWHWLPNYDIGNVKKLLAVGDEEKCPIIYNRSNYGADKKWVSKEETEEFIYPIVHSTPKAGIRYVYSNINDKGHFGVSKVIFGDNGLNMSVIDKHGIYGMSEHSMAIQTDEYFDEISDILTSDKFKSIIKTCMWGNFQIDWRLFTYFKKDFWKYV